MEQTKDEMNENENASGSKTNDFEKDPLSYFNNNSLLTINDNAFENAPICLDSSKEYLVIEAIKEAFKDDNSMYFTLTRSESFHKHFQNLLKEDNPTFKKIFSYVHGLMCLNGNEYLEERSKAAEFESIEQLRYSCRYLKNTLDSEISFLTKRMTWFYAVIDECGAESEQNITEIKLHIVCEFKLKEILKHHCEIRKSILSTIKILLESKIPLSTGLAVLADKEDCIFIGVEVDNKYLESNARICFLNRFNIATIEGMCKAFVLFLSYAAFKGNRETMAVFLANLRKDVKTSNSPQTNNSKQSQNCNQSFPHEHYRKDMKLLLQKKKIIQEKSRKILQDASNFVK
ncbi:hypothetical protein ABK040_014269 [Willaertia magna]